MIYFGYSSNINVSHLHEYLDTHGVTLDTELRGRNALLHDYRLPTNHFAGSHGAGACNIETDAGNCVAGVVMATTPAIQDVLRVTSPRPNGKRKRPISRFGFH